MTTRRYALAQKFTRPAKNSVLTLDLRFVRRKYLGDGRGKREGKR